MMYARLDKSLHHHAKIKQLFVSTKKNSKKYYECVKILCRFIANLKLLEDGEMEVAELLFQVALVAVGVLVDQGVELGGVVHVCQMGQFVADDVSDEFLGQKHEVSGKLDDALGSAVA